MESNGVAIEAIDGFLEVGICPLSGHGHDFNFIIDSSKRKLTNLVVGEIAPQPEMDE